MHFELDIKSLAEAVKSELSKPQKVWDDIVPILETDHGITIYLTDGIGAPAEYNEMCYRIRNADKPVEIILNTPGGIMESAVMIINAIRDCRHPVTAVVDGSVASAGAMITLVCTHLMCKPHASFMCHEVSMDGVGGKFSDIKNMQNHFEDYFKNLSIDLYTGFLSLEEIEELHRGKELWFTTDEVVERWDSYKPNKALR